MKLTFLFIITGLLSASFCNRSSDFANTEILRNETYGPNARNKMDVYLPANRDSNTATVMLIHGGAWMIGSKSGWPKDVISGILKQGYAVTCINYRYACGDFHVQMDDVKMAINFINTKSATWKTGHGKLGLVGVSAGAHMALLYANAYDSTGNVKAVVSLAGPTDLSDKLLFQYLQHYGIGFCLKRFLGSSLQDNPKVYADASPIFHCSNVPCLFINGGKDDLVPAVQAFRMHDTLMAHGVPTDTVVFGNAGHYIYGPRNVNDAPITTRINNWMKLYLH